MTYDFLFLSQDDVQSLCITMEDVMTEVESELKLKGEEKDMAYKCNTLSRDYNHCKTSR